MGEKFKCSSLAKRAQRSSEICFLRITCIKIKFLQGCIGFASSEEKNAVLIPNVKYVK